MHEVILRPSPRIHYLKILFCVLALTVALHVFENILKMNFFMWIVAIWGIGLFLAIVATVITRFHLLKLREEDIVMHVGILSTREVVMEYNQITNVNMKRTIIDRILGVGRIEIDTSGTHMVEIIMDFIPKKKLDEALELIRQKKAGIKK